MKVFNDFFVRFIEVLRNEPNPAWAVEKQVTTGDSLRDFYWRVRQALSEKSWQSALNICEHLSANPERKIQKTEGDSPFSSSYFFE